MLLTVQNDITRQPSTLNSFLSGTIGAGGTVLPVKNINGFQNQWAIQIGQTGEETAEILNISGVPTGTALNTSGTTRFNHAFDSPVYQTHYDQIIWLRSTTGTAGTAQAIATTNITPDSVITEYNDASGAATYAYQVQYYNSSSGDTSGTSSWFTPGGPTFYSFSKLKQRTKDKLYSAGYIRNDDLIGDWINEWFETMTNAAIKANQGYSIGTAQYTFGTAGIGTVTASDFKQPVKVEVSFDNGTTFAESTEIPLHSFTTGQDYFSTQYPRHAWVGETAFQVLPTGVTQGVFRLTYSARFTPLVQDSDELPQSLKAYTTSCTEYCLGVAYGLDQKDAESQQHYQMFGQGKADFIGEITPRDLTGVKTIDLVDGLSGMNEDTILSTEYFI